LSKNKIDPGLAIKIEPIAGFEDFVQVVDVAVRISGKSESSPPPPRPSPANAPCAVRTIPAMPNESAVDPPFDFIFLHAASALVASSRDRTIPFRCAASSAGMGVQAERLVKELDCWS
jgi:hypothetical protein